MLFKLKVQAIFVFLCGLLIGKGGEGKIVTLKIRQANLKRFANVPLSAAIIKRLENLEKVVSGIAEYKCLFQVVQMLKNVDI